MKLQPTLQFSWYSCNSDVINPAQDPGAALRFSLESVRKHRWLQTVGLKSAKRSHVSIFGIYTFYVSIGNRRMHSDFGFIRSVLVGLVYRSLVKIWQLSTRW